MYSKELIKGTVRTIVLKLLTVNERMYGYEITARVRELTSGRIQITEGALYPTLHKLVKEGLLEAETVHIGRRVRKYYSITAKGRIAARDRIQEFSSFVRTMQSLLALKPDPAG